MLVNNTATFGEKFLNKKTLMTKNIIKLEIIVIIRTVFYNRSNYDYHFIIAEIAKQLKQELLCLEENEEMHNFFNSNNKRSYKNW